MFPFCSVCSLMYKIGKNRWCCCFQFVKLNDHLFWKELFIRFTVRVLHGRLSNFVYVLLSLSVLRVVGRLVGCFGLNGPLR